VVSASVVVCLHAEQGRPTFRAHVATVPIYATVRSDDGTLVSGLTREDFEIKDNGVPRDITVFSRLTVPITVALMLDMSGSQERGVEWMRDAGHAFVEALVPADRMRIGTFGAEIAISPRLTGDRRYLHRVLDEEVWPGGGTPLWSALDRAMTSLGAEDGRRVILALTDGFDSMGPSMSTTDSGFQSASGEKWSVGTVAAPYARVRRRSIQEGFLLYAVAHEVPWAPIRLGRRPDLASLSQDMRDLALESGGGYRVFGLAKDANAAMVEVAEELHAQYELGFSPAAFDGKEHKLALTVRHRGMTVQARKSYVATP